MDRHAVLRPVGREPAAVYWRRRLLLLAIVAVVVAAVVWAGTSGSGSSRTPPATPAGSPPPGSSSTAAGSSAAGLALCRRADLLVSAATDATTYPAGATPKLTASLTNAGAQSCRFNAAASARVWRVLSGSDQVWSTADCSPSRAAAFAVLRHGHTISYTITWNRQRSTPGCASPGPAAQPGTYRLLVTIDRIAAAPAIFHLA